MANGELSAITASEGCAFLLGLKCGKVVGH